MKTILLSLSILLSGFIASGQNFIQFYADLANSCHQDSVTKYLQEFEALGVKEYNTTELQDARDWLLNKYSQWGYTDVVQDNFNVFGTYNLTNIVVTKTGTLYPNTYVIIDGHYDTKNGTGTNDNGTGTAILLELARLIKDIPTEYSIKFIHFSGEEIGLTGSDHYVTNVANPANMDIKVVFNIDEVGGINGMLNNTIVCERDESQPTSNDAQSAIMTNELATCIELYSTLQTEISYAYASDYIPFMNSGYVVTGLYEKNETPHAHTSSDSIAYVDIPYVYQITKGSMGALLHYAVAYDVTGLPELNEQTLVIYPNPVEEVLTVPLSESESLGSTALVYDLAGTLVKSSQQGTSEQLLLDVSALKAGTYILTVQSEAGARSGRFVKQ